MVDNWLPTPSCDYWEECYALSAQIQHILVAKWETTWNSEEENLGLGKPMFVNAGKIIKPPSREGAANQAFERLCCLVNDFETNIFLFDASVYGYWGAKAVYRLPPATGWWQHLIKGQLKIILTALKGQYVTPFVLLPIGWQTEADYEAGFPTEFTGTLTTFVKPQAARKQMSHLPYVICALYAVYLLWAMAPQDDQVCNGVAGTSLSFCGSSQEMLESTNARFIVDLDSNKWNGLNFWFGNFYVGC